MRSLEKEYTQQQRNCWTRHYLCGPCLIKGESVGLCVFSPYCCYVSLCKDVSTAIKNWVVFFCAVHVVSKESRRVILPILFMCINLDEHQTVVYNICLYSHACIQTYINLYFWLLKYWWISIYILVRGRSDIIWRLLFIQWHNCIIAQAEDA
jgi:hypothetical protein